jgi:hypothetical protein
MVAKKKSRTPAVRYLRYELTNSGSAGTETSHFIDLAKDLSALNRRLYRQGRMYHVKRISIVSSNTIAGVGVYDQTAFPGATTQTQNAGRVTFSCIPESWAAMGAWKRAFQTWQKMQRRAISTAGSDPSGTWKDFKVYLSQDHRSGTVLSPLDNGGNSPQSGAEWQYSQLVTPDGTTSANTFDLYMMGGHQGSAGSWSAVGLIKSYGESRATVQNTDPNVPTTLSDDPLVNVFDDGTAFDEIINDMEAHNDTPPYDHDSYPGDDTNMSKPLVVQQTTLGADGRATVGGFTAMCGLIEIESTSPIDNDVYSVLVELAPGSYRGIAAEVI